MKIQILDKSDRELRFVLEESNPQFANALRRIMISEVPVLAVESVDFYMNDSVLYDEVIAHRLALIPFTFNLKDFNFRDGCKCNGKGCSLCQVILVIDKKGPTTVYAKDIKSNNKDVNVLFGDIPIVEIEDGQRLKLEATAVLGIGKNHAKWQASNTSYRYYPVVELKGNLNNPQDCIKICPKNALTIDNNKAEITLECDLCKSCVKTAIPQVLEISGNPNKFIFSVESISGLNANDIIIEAVNILKNKAKEFEKEIKKLK